MKAMAAKTRRLFSGRRLTFVISILSFILCIALFRTWHNRDELQHGSEPIGESPVVESTLTKLPSDDVTDPEFDEGLSKTLLWNHPVPDRFIVNLHFWEKLAGSRLALSKWMVFASEIFPEFTMVEPSFSSRHTTLVGDWSPNSGGIPASRFFDLEHLSGFRFFPTEKYYQLDSRNPVSLGIHFEQGVEHRMRDKERIKRDKYQLPCRLRNVGRDGVISIKPMRRRLESILCLHPSIFKDPDASSIFQTLVGANRTIVFFNFDNRLHTPASLKALPWLEWKKEWHSMADQFVERIGRPFASFHFRAGKFYQHRHQQRILPCFRQMLRETLESSRNQNISTFYASLDVFGQGEANLHREPILESVRDLMSGQRVYYSGDPIRYSKVPTQSAPGKAILDNLIMSRADLWVGSGAHSGFARLALSSRKQIPTKEANTKPFYCEKDSDWNLLNLTSLR